MSLPPIEPRYHRFGAAAAAPTCGRCGGKGGTFEYVAVRSVYDHSPPGSLQRGVERAVAARSSGATTGRPTTTLRWSMEASTLRRTSCAAAQVP
jgi:hypothetical protein